MTSEANPYSPPSSDIHIAARGGVDETSPLSPAGRFSRLSYLGWTVLLGLVYGVTQVFAAMLTAGFGGVGQTPGAVGVVGLVGLLAALVAILYYGFVFAIRRCHDFNASGWWSLIVVIPILNLVFYLIPGTAGPNRFGPARPTRTWEKIVGIGLFVLLFVILAAIAIPAYHEYLERARAFEAQLGALMSPLSLA